MTYMSNIKKPQYFWPSYLLEKANRQCIIFFFFFERKTWQLLNLRILLGSDPSDSKFKGYYDSCDIIPEYKITHI